MSGKRTFLFLSSGLLAQNHMAAMGSALWLFLWLIDKTTSEEEVEGRRYGLVLYGRPVSPRLVTNALGLSERTYVNHLRRLKAGGYVTLTKQGQGYVIRVANSMKWQWREKEHGSNTSRRGGLGRPHGTNGSREEVDWDAEARRGWQL